MSTSERYVVMPLFMLGGQVMILIGLKAVKDKHIKGSLRDIRRGREEFAGRTAVAKGVILAIAGLGRAILALAMMIKGRTLLRDRILPG